MLEDPSTGWVGEQRKLIIGFKDTLYAESWCISNIYICVLLKSCLNFRRLFSENRGRHIGSPHHAAAAQFRCDTWIASNQLWHVSLSIHTCMYACPVVISQRGGREKEALGLHTTEDLILSLWGESSCRFHTNCIKLCISWWLFHGNVFCLQVVLGNVRSSTV